MARKFSSDDMRRAANILEHGAFCTDATDMLRKAADTYEKIEKEIKRLKDLLVPTCRNCGYRCAFRNGKTHCKNHTWDGSNVHFAEKIKYLKEFINGKKV